jgi:hypothetical protein
MPIDGLFWLLIAQWLLFWLFWHEGGYVAGA